VTFGRWVPGLLLVAGLAAVTVVLVTSPGRASLAELRAEAADLADRERELLERLSTFATAEAGMLNFPTEAIWAEGTSASVEIAMQEALVTQAATAELKLVTFGQTTGPATSVRPSIGFELELTGTHEGLARFLAGVESVRPALAISYLWLRQLPPNPMRTGAPISIRLTVWGFRDEVRAP
jgi:hypothetical protein